MTVSEWLEAEIFSHDIYDTTLLKDLPEPVTYDPATDKLVMKDGKSATLHSQSAVEMRQNDGAVETGNPKGAYLPDEVDPTLRLFPGFGLSAVLDRLLTGEDGGSTFMGRGTAHRARVAHIKAAGF